MWDFVAALAIVSSGETCVVLGAVARSSSTVVRDDDGKMASDCWFKDVGSAHR